LIEPYPAGSPGRRPRAGGDRNGMKMQDNSPHFIVEEHDGEKRIRVVGELNYYHFAEFKDTLRHHLEAKSCPLSFVLDMEECPFIDSGCLGMIAEFKKEVDRRGCSLRIENVNDHVGEAMRRIRLDTIITITGKEK